MLDTTVRPWLNPVLNALGNALARRGVSANQLTILGALIGLGAAVLIAHQHYALAFWLMALNRLLDGLDGAVARATTISDRGGYLDIVADYIFYASVPFAFALANPPLHALPAAALLAAFCLTASSFLVFAAIAAKRGLKTDRHGEKSIFYSTGLVEGTETVVMFLLMAALPDWFPTLAWLFAGACVITVIQRSILALRTFD